MDIEAVTTLSKLYQKNIPARPNACRRLPAYVGLFFLIHTS